jgi:DNA-binding CsgD family transcriptional regulator
MESFLTPVLVGRSRELSQLEDTLTIAQSGSGGCVIVAGEAGIGKSRLLAEIRNRAIARGFTVLVGRCFEQDMAFPYAPLIDILRTYFTPQTVSEILASFGSPTSGFVNLLPELAAHVSDQQPAAPLEPEAERRRLVEALGGFFLRQSEDQPLVLIVEDLHWSDAASLEFLLFLARRIAPYPLLLLLSYRSTETHPELMPLLAGLDREQMTQTLKLKPLSHSEVSQMLQAILNQPQAPSAEFVETVYNLTEGNPFFTEEIFSSLTAAGDIYFAGGRWQRKPLSQIEIPDSVQRLVQQRLSQISQTARQLITLAAVSGRSFDFAVLQALTSQSDQDLLALVKELMVAQLVVEETAELFAFRHALTREALYVQLLARERKTLHGQIAQAIEHIHANTLETQLEALAYHFFEAAMWTKALEYTQRAGEKAQALYAPHAAIEQFTRALEAASRLSLTPPSHLYRLRGQAFDTLGEFDRARVDYEAALQTARTAGDQRAEWQALLDLALLWASRDYERTGDYCRQALTLAHFIGDQAILGHSLNRLGNWYMNSGQPFEALGYHQNALNLFEALADRPGIAATLDLLAMTSNQCGDVAGTVAYYERAIPILRDLNDHQTLASSLTMLSVYSLNEALVREAIELARDIDWRAGEAYALQYLGMLLAYRGDYGPGLIAAQSGLELARAIDHRLWQAWGDLTVGHIYLELLALDEAYQHLESGRAIATEVGSSFMTKFAAGLLASVCILQGRPDEAAVLLPERLPEPALGLDFTIAKATMELALVRHQPSQALHVLDSPDFPDRVNWLGGMAFFYGSVIHLRGEALMLLGRLEEAEATLQSILDLYLEQGLRMGLWQIQLSLGKLYQAAADNERAETAFAAARTLVEELAATVADDSLRENFRRRANARIPPVQPLTPRQVAKQEFGGLTQRERQVASAVAQGLSNQGIADELVVSVKTVEAHVSRILSKLGFSSRAQIAAWAVDRGLAPPPQDLDSLSANP